MPAWLRAPARPRGRQAFGTASLASADTRLLNLPKAARPKGRARKTTGSSSKSLGEPRRLHPEPQGLAPLQRALQLHLLREFRTMTTIGKASNLADPLDVPSPTRPHSLQLIREI